MAPTGNLAVNALSAAGLLNHVAGDKLLKQLVVGSCTHWLVTLRVTRTFIVPFGPFDSPVRDQKARANVVTGSDVTVTMETFVATVVVRRRNASGAGICIAQPDADTLQMVVDVLRRHGLVVHWVDASSAQRTTLEKLKVPYHFGARPPGRQSRR